MSKSSGVPILTQPPAGLIVKPPVQAASLNWSVSSLWVAPTVTLPGGLTWGMGKKLPSN